MAREQDILQDAMERFQASEAASNEMRTLHRSDTKFCNLGEQWTDWDKAQRAAENRPYWTVNRLRPMVTQVINDIRQNRPTIYIAPSDNGADAETADVLREVIRSIIRTPAAEAASDGAAEAAIVGGYGFMRVVLDYAHPNSFDLVPIVERIADPNLVFWDADTAHEDAGDWGYGFLATHMLKREFERKYPKHTPIDWSMSTATAQNLAREWAEEENVRLADYYVREPYEYTLLQLSDGRVIREKDLAAEARQYFEALGIDDSGTDRQAIEAAFAATGLTVQRERKGEDYSVKIYTICGDGILDEQDWPGRSIPIVPVWGQETVIDGHRDLRGMVRDARDPQRLLNYWRTSATERGALASRAPWLIEDGSIPPAHMHAWQTANTRNHPYLVYAEGTNKPQREPPPSVPAGDLQLAMNAAEDLQSITGFYPAALGARSNETSGRAILARQRESDTGSFHFVDNLNRAFKYLGQVLLEVIPEVYSERQVVRVLGEDKAEKVYKLTRSETGQASVALDGGERLYDLNVGTYDVYVEVGPNYASQREADRETIVELSRAFPPMLQYGFDLVMDLLDVSNRDEWKERYQQIQAAMGMGPAPEQVPPQPVTASMQPPLNGTPQPGMMNGGQM